MNESGEVLKLVRQRKRIPISIIAYRLDIPGKYVESIVETLQEYNLVNVTSQSNGDKIIEINQKGQRGKKAKGLRGYWVKLLLHSFTISPLYPFTHLPFHHFAPLL